MLRYMLFWGTGDCTSKWPQKCRHKFTDIGKLACFSLSLLYYYLNTGGFLSYLCTLGMLHFQLYKKSCDGYMIIKKH